MRVVLLLTILLIIPSTAAVWEAHSTETRVGEGNVLFARGVNAKIADINTADSSVTIRATVNGNPVYDDALTVGEVFTINKRARYELTSVEPTATGAHASFAIEAWYGGKLGKTNMPERLYTTDIYRVYTTVHNTNPVTTTYDVGFHAPDGFHVETTRSDGQLSYRQSEPRWEHNATHTITLEPGQHRRVYFAIQPIEKETSGDVTFSLSSTSGQLITQTTREVTTTTDAVAYIEDITTPEVMRSGETGKVDVKVRFSWIGSTSDLYVSLMGREFKIPTETKRVRAFHGDTQTVSFDAMPYGGGNFTLMAEANVGRQPTDDYTIQVPAVGPKVYSITDVKLPNTLEAGEQGDVFVTIANRGEAANSLSVSIESDDFELVSPKPTVRLSPGADTRVLLQVRARTDDDIAGITVNLVDEPTSHFGRQFEARTTVDSFEDVITIQQPPEPEPTVPELERNVSETDENTTVVVNDSVDQPPSNDTYTPKQIDDDVWEAWPYLAAAALVVLLFLAFLAGKRVSTT